MQAARGASLTGDENETGTTRTRGPRGRHLLLFAAVAIAAYAVDVVSKVVVVEKLADRADVQVVGDLLVLHLVRNAGAAFSTGTAYTEVFSVVAICAVLVIAWFARRIGSSGSCVSLNRSIRRSG